MPDTLTGAHAALLARTDVFARLDRVALARLAACAEPLSFDVEAVVCREGDPADGLYVAVRGTFGIFAADSTTGREGRIGAFGPGDVFGEMALLADEPRSATIRAETGGEVLRLERQRFLALLKAEPGIGLAIASTLARRLRDRDRLEMDDQAATVLMVDAALGTLSPQRRAQILEASVLSEPHPARLRVMFGAEGELVARAIGTLGVEPGRFSPAVHGELRARFARAVGVAGVERAAEIASFQLLDAGDGEEALRILDHHGLHAAFARALARVLQADPGLPPARLEHWLMRLLDEDANVDLELVFARASLLAGRGERTKAIALLRRALRSDLATRDETSAERLSIALAELDTPPASLIGRLSRRWRTSLALGIAAACTGLVVVGSLVGAGPAWSFAWLLAAAVVLWIADVFPSSTVALGLIAAWVLSGTARPDQAAAGFASLDWLFVLAVLGISAAVARSGLLFRVGLLLVRRLPDGLFWQSGSLMLTGLLLTPLLPTSTGRAAITEPLALAIADGLRLRERQNASAVLGLAAWIGAGPLRFLFLNGSATCLLAWGLLSATSRARFDWVNWTLAALPFAVAVGLGSLGMLFVVLRPEPTPATGRGHLDVQLSVLGPPTRREMAMLAVLLLTVGCWIAAPVLHVEVGVIAILGLLAAVATGNLDRQALQKLDWDYLVFYGVALSLVRLGAAIGLDHLVGDAIGARLAASGANALEMVLGIAILGAAVGVALGPDQTVLLLGLALVPTAAALGLDPWVIVVTILATTGLWLIPSQVPMYLAAYSASEGRLFGPAQSRRAAFGYLAVLLAGLVVTLPYWHLLGLL